MASTPGIKYPKLRTRQQLTVRYHQLQDERKFWQSTRAAITTPGIVGPLPRVQAVIERHIDVCEAQLDALLFALNDRV